jgi:DTW domain-containing protein YfiP
VHFDGLPAVHLQVSDFLDYDMKRNQNEDMLCKAMIILLRDLENNRIQDSTELLPRHYATHEWAVCILNLMLFTQQNITACY